MPKQTSFRISATRTSRPVNKNNISHINVEYIFDRCLMGKRQEFSPDLMSGSTRTCHSMIPTSKCKFLVHKSQQGGSSNSTNTAQGQRAKFCGNYRNYSIEMQHQSSPWRQINTRFLAWGPVHLPASKEMNVDVVNRLTCN